MEWKSSTDKQKYGDMIGEVVHHKLFEDGTIPSYDVKFGNKTIKNIPSEMLEVVNMQEHSHEATEEDEDDMEEGMLGGLLGVGLADKGVGQNTSMLRYAAGGYFGHKAQEAANKILKQGKYKEKDYED
jgi:hypothetical protein